jgi:hypothetical protein
MCAVVSSLNARIGDKLDCINVIDNVPIR